MQYKRVTYSHNTDFPSKLNNAFYINIDIIVIGNRLLVVIWYILN